MKHEENAIIYFVDRFTTCTLTEQSFHVRNCRWSLTLMPIVEKGGYIAQALELPLVPGLGQVLGLRVRKKQTNNLHNQQICLCSSNCMEESWGGCWPLPSRSLGPLKPQEVMAPKNLKVFLNKRCQKLKLEVLYQNMNK